MDMGLDVGVVRIENLRMDRAVSDFMRRVYENADELEWSVIDSGEVFVQTSPDTLMERANAFASESDLARNDVEGLRNWIEALPSRGGMVMLHLNW